MHIICHGTIGAMKVRNRSDGGASLAMLLSTRYLAHQIPRASIGALQLTHARLLRPHTLEMRFKLLHI